MSVPVNHHTHNSHTHNSHTHNLSAEASPPQGLHDFQQSFGQYLRQSNLDSNSNSTSQNIRHTQATHLYQSLVFNNICGFLNACFPVCQTLISQEHWSQLSREFFKQQQLTSPYFSKINQSFVVFLSQNDVLKRLALPDYFAELAHYEWIELFVDTQPDTIPNMALTTITDTQNNSSNEIRSTLLLTLNPTLQNLHYQWPIHLINTDNPTVYKADSFYLIHRHPHTNTVQFMQINALTHALVDFIALHSVTVMTDGLNQTANTASIASTDLILLFDKSLDQFSQHLNIENTPEFIEFGRSLLDQLFQQHVLRTHLSSGLL